MKTKRKTPESYLRPVDSVDRKALEEVKIIETRMRLRLVRINRHTWVCARPRAIKSLTAKINEQ